MTKILLTGFEPFAEWSVNPTQEAVIDLNGTHYNGTRVIGEVLPLEYRMIRSTLRTLVETHQPASIIMTGQAGGSKIRLEQIAVNEATTNTPYNCGSTPSGEILIEGAPQSLTSNLPLRRYYKKLSSEKIPVRYSASAGKYGCNQIFFVCRYDYPSLPTGFIHVPLLPHQVMKDQPSMTQEIITNAMDLICQETATYLRDLI